jgi:hypothetical protein
MARKTDPREEEFDDAPASSDARPGLVELDPEKEALRLQVEDLRRQLDAARSSARSSAAALEVQQTAPGTVSEYWRVKLQHGPEHVVRSIDAANAWERYRLEMGVLRSEAVPEVSPANREEYHAAQARRHGKKVDDPEFSCP